MTMSEKDWKVLEELEASFRTATASRRHSSRSRLRPATRLLISLVVLPAALLVVVLGVVLNGAPGVVLAVAGYLLTVACVRAGVDHATRGWARVIGWTRPRLGPASSRNHR